MEIPENTQFFTYYNNNPKNRQVGDCVTRAISKALNQDYAVTILELAHFQAITGYPVDEQGCYGEYLKYKDWVKCKQPILPNGKKVRGKDFFLMNRYIPCILHIGSGHISCIVDGKIHDIWDCSNEYVGNFWIPKMYADQITVYSL